MEQSNNVCKCESCEHKHDSSAELGSHIGCDCGSEHSHGEKNNLKIMIMRLAFGAVLLGATFFVPTGIIKYAVAICAYLILGYDVVISAIKNHKMDEHMLMFIASMGALIIGDCSEGVAVMLLYQTGEMFQDMAVDKSKKSISSLMSIKVDDARVLRGGREVVEKCENIHVGDIIIVGAGERIALDGIIIDGKTSLDTSALTGESMPRDVETGDAVLSGAININKTVKVKVEKEFGESTVSKILKLVQQASEKKAPTEKFITKFAKYYTPIVVGIAVLLIFIPCLFFGGIWSEWLYKGLAFLVVSCPCALVISVPLSFFAGIGGASRQGILIKGSNYMEAISKSTVAVFDKTGTLTKGAFDVDKIITKLDENELLYIAASLENYSSHPIAKSIINAYGKPIDTSDISDVEEISGKGIKGKISGKSYFAGNKKFFDEMSIETDDVNGGATVVYVADDEKYLGAILIRDKLKDDSKSGIDALKKAGVKKIVMLTGDNDASAKAIGEEIGIDEIYSQLLPGDKVSIVEKLKSELGANEKLIFTGDGINDAPVLALADVGIAMGGIGSDAAIEAADVVLMDDRISKIPVGIKICKKTLKIVKENITIAIGIKIIVMILVAMGLSTMWLAIFADVGVSLLAVVNSLRCLKAPK